MFQALAPGTKLDTSLDRTVGLQRSIGPRPVSLEGGVLEARAYVVGAYERTHGYTVYLLLAPRDAAPAPLYVSSGGPLPLAQYPVVERGALDMAEEMGFVMEPVDLVNMDADCRAEILREVPFALPTVTGVAPAAESWGQESSAARGQSAGHSGDGDGFGVPAQEAIASLGRLLAIF